MPVVRFKVWVWVRWSVCEWEWSKRKRYRTKVSSALWLLLLLRWARFFFTIDCGFLTFNTTESLPVSSNTIRFTTLDLSLLFFFRKNFLSFSAGRESRVRRRKDWEREREKKKKLTINRWYLSIDMTQYMRLISEHTQEKIFHRYQRFSIGFARRAPYRSKIRWIHSSFTPFSLYILYV